MKNYDVLCVGNALVDLIAFCTDDFLVENNIIKGSMNLVDLDRIEYLRSRIKGSIIQIPGGSANNTAVGVAALGGASAFIGKVAGDSYGDLYVQNLQSHGVTFETQTFKEEGSTACSIILVTPDGQRSMSTYLGVSTHLSCDDMDESRVENATISYFEGYLWDSPVARDLCYLIASHARKVGRKVAVTLSDSFCVEKHRNEFLKLLRQGIVDLVFANVQEIKSLYQTSSLELALDEVRKDCPLSIITRSEEGSIIIHDDNVIFIDPRESNVVDTTGAGDLYAAGFLFCYTQGYDLKTCGRVASFVAGLIVEQTGSRFSGNLVDCVKAAGFLESSSV